MLKSKVLIFTLLISFLLSIFIFQKKDVIFQEGNPIPLAVAILKMNINDKEIVEVWKHEQYLVKRGKMEPFIKMKEKEGWKFVEKRELSNALVFEKGDKTLSVRYKYFTRYYTIIFSP